MASQAVAAQIELGPGWSATLEPTDSDAASSLDKLFGDPKGRRVVMVARRNSDDVAGHGIEVTIDVTIEDADDVQGHAFTLRFPDADAAQRLRLKLAAGVLVAATLTVGGTAIATDLMAQPHVGAPDIAVPAVPAKPTISRGLQADIISGDIITEEAVPTKPTISRGLQADIISGDIVAEQNAVPPAWATKRPTKQ
jgi:hypothetical protein